MSEVVTPAYNPLVVVSAREILLSGIGHNALKRQSSIFVTEATVVKDAILDRLAGKSIPLDDPSALNRKTIALGVQAELRTLASDFLEQPSKLRDQVLLPQDQLLKAIHALYDRLVTVEANPDLKIAQADANASDRLTAQLAESDHPEVRLSYFFARETQREPGARHAVAHAVSDLIVAQGQVIPEVSYG